MEKEQFVIRMHGHGGGYFVKMADGDVITSESPSDAHHFDNRFAALAAAGQSAKFSRAVIMPYEPSPAHAAERT